MALLQFSGMVVATTVASELDANVNEPFLLDECKWDHHSSDCRNAAFNWIAEKGYWVPRGSESCASISGDGSCIDTTASVRNCLSTWIIKYNIDFITDIPCGDCTWQAHIPGLQNIRYRGYDIAEKAIKIARERNALHRNMEFGVLDLVSTVPLETPDIIMVRDVMQHLPLESGKAMLRNAKASGAKYLAVSTFPFGSNRDVYPGQHYDSNIHKPPFHLPPALETCRNFDGSYDDGARFELINLTAFIVYADPCSKRGAGIDGCFPGKGFDGSPAVFEEGLEPEPHANIIAAIQSHLPQIRSELQESLSGERPLIRGWGESSTIRQGWSQMYTWTRQDGWRTISCLMYLRTLCGVLRSLLPSTRLPLISPSQTAVELFGMSPGVHIEAHDDTGEGRVCSLICLDGCDGGAWLRVHDRQGSQTHRFSQLGQSVTFDSLYKHEGGHDGDTRNSTRWALSVCLPHPGYAANIAKFSDVAFFKDDIQAQRKTTHRCIFSDGSELWHECIPYLFDSKIARHDSSDRILEIHGSVHTECLPLTNHPVLFKRRWKRASYMCVPTSARSKRLLRQALRNPSLCQLYKLPGDFHVCANKNAELDIVQLSSTMNRCEIIIKHYMKSSHLRGVFIDVGSNMGVCAVAVLSCFSMVHPTLVISITPNPQHLAQLTRTRAMLPLQMQRRWFLLQVGLGPAEGMHADHVQQVSAGPLMVSSSLVPVLSVPLDSLLHRLHWNSTALGKIVSTHRFSTISVMDMSTVGHELAALQGMRQLLHFRMIKSLLFDFSPAALLMHHFAPYDVLNELLQANYEIYDEEDDDLRPLSLTRLQYLGCSLEWQWTVASKRDFRLSARPLPRGHTHSELLRCSVTT